MTSDPPTIDLALAAFLAEKEAAAKPKAFRQYADIVELLTHSLNGYAYDALVGLERRRWEKAFRGRRRSGVHQALRAGQDPAASR